MGDKITVACKLPNGLNLGNGIVLVGANHPSNVGGFGLTPNVDADAFDKWLVDHASLDVVKKGLIFANDSGVKVADEAQEKAELRSGLEPLDPNKLPAGLERVEGSEPKPGEVPAGGPPPAPLPAGPAPTGNGNRSGGRQR